MDKAEPSVGIALCVVVGQRLIEISSRVREIAHREAAQTNAAPSGRNFHQASFVLGLSQERRGYVPRHPRLATNHAANPLAVVCCEPLSGVVDPSSEFAGAGEGGFRFFRAEATEQ